MKKVRYMGGVFRVEYYNWLWWWVDGLGVILKSKCLDLEVGMKRIRVRIIKGKIEKHVWYVNLDGHECDVEEVSNNSLNYKTVGQDLYIRKEHCKIIKDIKKPALAEIVEVKSCGNCAAVNAQGGRCHERKSNPKGKPCHQWKSGYPPEEELKQDQNPVKSEQKPDQEKWFVIREIKRLDDHKSSNKGHIVVSGLTLGNSSSEIDPRHVFPASRIRAAPDFSVSDYRIHFNENACMGILPEEKAETKEAWLVRMPEIKDYMGYGENEEFELNIEKYGLAMEKWAASKPGGEI